MRIVLDTTILVRVAFLRHVAETVTLDATLSVPIRDVNDILVAQTPILGEANMTCTMDRDSYDRVAQHFLIGFGITVVTDVGLIHRIRNHSL